ncbi:hypothetical protein HZS_4188 [Henneguya salminicola]|nr:hypothetical protein HZS_4188 [Henneguya salminicola]
MKDVPRTNNVVEWWHRAFSTKEQLLTDVKIDNTPTQPQNEMNLRTSFLNQRIRTLAARFHEKKTITFLENMAYLIL